VQHLFVANTHDHLLFFTNQGRVYARRVYDVPEMSRTSQGRAVANLLEFQTGEKIANVLAVEDFSKGEQFLMFATQKGVVKKTALGAYGNIRSNGIIAIGLEDNDQLIGVEITNGKDQVILGTKLGLAIRFDEDEVRAMGRPAGGVTGARFKREGDEVVAMLVAPEALAAATPAVASEGTAPATGETPASSTAASSLQILTACVHGYGKRTPLEEYPVKGRGTRGVINIDANERNGQVVEMKLVSESDEVMLITEKGILIRTKVAEIRQTGRDAQGVRLIKLDDGDKLVAMAKIDADDVVPPATDEKPADDKADGEKPTP
jgi:DNA gyrase subunit A